MWFALADASIKLTDSEQRQLDTFTVQNPMKSAEAASQTDSSYSESASSFDFGQGDAKTLASGEELYSGKLAPAAIVGREEEKNLLLDCYKSADRSRQVLFLGGAAGTGKSSLVDWLRHSTDNDQRYLALGKYTQSQHGEPYAAITHICCQLCRTLKPYKHEDTSTITTATNTNTDSNTINEKDDITLTTTESEAEVEKEELIRRLSCRLGDGAKFLARVVPDLRQMLNTNEEDIESTGARVLHFEERAQVHRAFRVFFRTLCEVKRVVLALDDLQWADHDSLELLEYLIKDQGNTNLLIVGCYRDDEISPEHKLSELVSNVYSTAEHDALLGVNKIVLGSLNVDVIDDMILQMIGGDNIIEETRPLAEVIHERTGGNALFASQLIQSLLEEHLLYLDEASQKYQYDLDQVRLQTSVTPNVLELMQNKLERFPPVLKCLAQLATCLGTILHKDLLEIIAADFGAHPTLYFQDMSQIQSKSKKYNVKSLLKRLEKEGFIYMMQGQNEMVYRWVHDKIQEASSLKKSRRAEIHGRVGELLIQRLTEKKLEKHLFSVVSLLNDGSTLIRSSDATKRVQLAELNLRAGQKGLKASSFESATKFFTKGIKLLPSNHWRIYTDLSLKLYSFAAEANYCMGYTADLERICREVISNPIIKLEDKRRVYFVLCEGLNGRGAPDESLKVGSELLDAIGCKYPKKIQVPYILSGILLFKSVEKAGLAQRLKSLPKMRDSRILWEMELCHEMTKFAYLSNREAFYTVLIIKMFRQTLKYGICEYTPTVIAQVASLCTVIGLAEVGRAYSDQSLVELSRSYSARCLAMVFTNAFIFVNHWTDELRYCNEQMLQGHKVGMAAGVVENSCWLRNHVASNSYFIGCPLKEVFSLANENAIETKELHVTRPHSYALFLLQSIANLTGDSEHASELSGDFVCASEKHLEFVKTKNFVDMAILQWNRICLAYFLDDHELVFRLRKQMNEAEMQKASPGIAFSRITHFVFAMSSTAMFRKTKKRKYRRLAKNLYATISKWVKGGDPNCVHYAMLVEAELFDLQRDGDKAIGCFSQAIRLAAKRGHIHDQAEGYQRLGELYLRRSEAGLATASLAKSVALFSQWGATARVNRLRSKYAELLASTSSTVAPSPSLEEPLTQVPS